MGRKQLTQREVFTGSALGTFVGDAFGAVVEGFSPAAIRSLYGMLKEPKRGLYTDDTQMMIGLIEALLEDPAFSQEIAAHKFLDNFDPSRGYGGRIFGVMNRIKSKIPANEVGTDSWGNGAAMRIAPIGFFFYDNQAKLVDAAIRSAEITHKHPNGIAGAVAQAGAVAHAVRMALAGDEIFPEEFADKIIGSIEKLSPPFVSELNKLKEIESGGIERGIEFLTSHFSRDVSAIGAVPAAIGAFLLSNSFDKAVIIAVNSGGDADTTGAMAGAIAGAYWGEGGIPKEWLEIMEDDKKGKSYVKNMAAKLAELKIERDN
jgi:poly(ADP-ribose) glycohydrolase ARH3